MITIWLIYFLAATAASGIFIAASWRGTQVLGVSSARGRNGFPANTLWQHPESDLAASPACADVDIAVRLAVKRLAAVMTNQSIQTEVAVPPGLMLRMRAPTLADLLEDLLTAAIHGAPASRLLLTASQHGDRVYITVTDDMPGANATVRTASVRGLTERVALRGGALDVTVSPMEGTSLTLRFAAAVNVRQDKKTHALPGFVKAVPARPIQVAGQP